MATAIAARHVYKHRGTGITGHYRPACAESRSRRRQRPADLEPCSTRVLVFRPRPSGSSSTLKRVNSQLVSEVISPRGNWRMLNSFPDLARIHSLGAPRSRPLPRHSFWASTYTLFRHVQPLRFVRSSSPSLKVPDLGWVSLFIVHRGTPCVRRRRRRVCTHRVRIGRACAEGCRRGVADFADGAIAIASGEHRRQRGGAGRAGALDAKCRLTHSSRAS